MLGPRCWFGTLALVVGFGCNTVTPASGDESDTYDTWSSDDGGLPLANLREVDVLFVIDNSASMAPAQARLAKAIDVLVDALELADADYRIGITTTDNGNPWCTSPATAGQLLASSCTTRLDDFVLDGGVIDAQSLGCTELCTLTPAELEIQPSTTDVDSNPAPRPWIEDIADTTNLLPGTDVAEALRCLLPQGITGCEFEAPLESMRLALTRSTQPEDPNYGFHRVDAVLLVVLLSDGADCSHAPDWEEIFSVDGLKTFWSDPDASVPTSALCWNAGVECEGDPAGYDSCEPADKTVDGLLDASIDDSVLHPLTRYMALLYGLQTDAQNFHPNLDVIVATIGGVDEAGVATYADAIDPAFQDSYGIGPGCVGTNPLDPNVPQQAVPPVRTRALAEFMEDRLYSICAESYVDTLTSVAADVTSQFEPACLYHCLKDVAPATPGLQPDCTLERSASVFDGNQDVPECAREGGAYVLDPETGRAQLPSLEDDVCYVLRIDSDLSTSDPLDDMSTQCVALHYNAEMQVVHRPGVPDPAGTTYAPSCQIADFPDVACPAIGSP
jgi:hypothetical protein